MTIQKEEVSKNLRVPEPFPLRSKLVNRFNTLESQQTPEFANSQTFHWVNPFRTMDSRLQKGPFRLIILRFVWFKWGRVIYHKIWVKNIASVWLRKYFFQQIEISTLTLQYLLKEQLLNNPNWAPSFLKAFREALNLSKSVRNESGLVSYLICIRTLILHLSTAAPLGQVQDVASRQNL